MPKQAALASSAHSANDIFFPCDHCGTLLVVDRAATGLILNCQRCQQPTRVPNPTEPHLSNVQAPEVLADLEGRLKENEAQRIEITGYINQLSIQLHRWQLRLQTLDERRSQLQQEIAAIIPRNGS